jgi:hypothetical protein
LAGSTGTITTVSVPVLPRAPFSPVSPVAPAVPVAPVVPVEPVEPVAPVAPAGPGTGTVTVVGGVTTTARSQALSASTAAIAENTIEYFMVVLSKVEQSRQQDAVGGDVKLRSEGTPRARANRFAGAHTFFSGNERCRTVAPVLRAHPASCPGLTRSKSNCTTTKEFQMKLSKLLVTTTAAAAMLGSIGLASAQSGYVVFEQSTTASHWAPNGNDLRADPRMVDPGNPIELWPRFIPVAVIAPVERIVEVDRPVIVERIVEVEQTRAVAVQPRRVDRN